MPRDKEHYSFELVNEVLNKPECLRQHRFDFLRGCPTPSRPRGVELPVYAYYPQHQLVVEFREGQHRCLGPALWDNRTTAIGVSRKVQRQIYDAKRERVLPQHGFAIIVIHDFELTYKDRNRDLTFVKGRLEANEVRTHALQL